MGPVINFFSQIYSFALKKPELPKLAMESRIVGFGIRNTAQGIRNPTNDWNPGPGIRNPQRGVQNPRLSWILYMGLPALGIMKRLV